MISMGKSFDENIAAGNQQYEKLCYQLINHGKIDDRLTVLMDTNDMANIVVLSIIKCWDHGSHKRTQKIGKLNVSFINSVGGQQMIQCVENIGKLYATLPQDTKESLIKSFGLECLIDLKLDEIGEFRKVCKEMSDRFMKSRVKSAPTSSDNAWENDPSLLGLK